MSPNFTTGFSEGYEASSRLANLLSFANRMRNAGTLYDILNIPQTSTKQEIEEAFERAKQTVDPNIQTARTVEMASRLTLKLYGAHTVLSDDLQRQRYDDSLRDVDNIPTRYAVISPQEVITNNKDIEHIYWIIRKTKDYTPVHEHLIYIYRKIRMYEQEWRRGRDNRIYGASTPHLVEADGDNYETYFANVRARAQRLALSDSLDLAVMTTEIQDFRTALTSCYHSQFATSVTNNTWLRLFWAETERLSDWISTQRYSAQWYIDQVELHLQLHIMKARALHVWPIYQAGGTSTPVTFFIPNYLPNLSEVDIIQRIRTTPCYRSSYDRGMRKCCGEDLCNCRGFIPALEYPPPTLTERLTELIMSPFQTVGKTFKKIML